MLKGCGRTSFRVILIWEHDVLAILKGGGGCGKKSPPFKVGGRGGKRFYPLSWGGGGGFPLLTGPLHYFLSSLEQKFKK